MKFSMTSRTLVVCLTIFLFLGHVLCQNASDVLQSDEIQPIYQSAIGATQGGRNGTYDEECREEFLGGAAHVRYQSDADICICAKEFIGPACDVCTTDRACSTVSNATTTCANSVALNDKVDTKSFLCQLDVTSPIKSFLGSGDVWGGCDLLDKSCSVNFAGNNLLLPHVSCKSSECSFTSDSFVSDNDEKLINTNVTCKTTQCGPGPSGNMEWPTSIPAFLRTALESTNASSASKSPPFNISCYERDADLDPSWNQETQRLLIPAAKCIIEIGDVPVPIGLSCAFGDCYDDTSLTAAENLNETLLDPPGILQRDFNDSENIIGSGTMRSPESASGDSIDPGKLIMSEPISDSDSLSSLGSSSASLGRDGSSTTVSNDESQCKEESDVGINHVMVNPETNQCVCKEGWKGPECNVCNSNEVCGSEESVCLKSPAIVEAIANKTYSCELEDNSPLLPFLGVGNFWGQCDLGNKTCSVNFGGANTTQPHVTCLGTECAFGSAAAPLSNGGSTNIGDIKTDIECSSTSCSPSEKFGWPSTLPTFIRDPLGSQTTSIKISCTGSDTAVCTVNVALIPLPIDINCSFGDCYQKLGDDESSGDTSSSLALVEDPEISEDNTSNQYNPLPKEMIFLPIVIIAVLAFAAGALVYIETKKQYLRSLFAKEMKSLTGSQQVKGLAVSDMSPALNSPEAYYPEYARSDKFADIHMNIMSELSFTDIYYDVVANGEDEAWMEEGNSMSIRETVSQLNLKVRESVRNILHTRKSQELPHKADSKHIEFVSTTFKSRGQSLEEANSMPEIAFEGDGNHEQDSGSPDSDDDLDLEKIYTPQDDKIPSMSPSSATNSNHILDKVRNAPNHHRRDSSASAGAGLMSGFGNTIQRTASRVRETFKSQFTRKKKRILHGVTGSIYRGNMLAIMGPSGCGKSTLLNILADENLFGAKVRGNVYIDGKKRQKWYRHITVYIPQSDELIPILTVMESVLYSGLLRLPWYYSRGRRVHKVYDVLDQLKIDHVAESQVGGSCDIRGISGGERRRVSIGMGLVADPKIMILDEPTSGLDSAAASSIVTTLKDLAGKGDGRIVIASLHQPSFETFRELDLLLLLAKGRQVYFGEASGVKQHFDKCGFPCPKGLNIADYILHVVVDLNCLRELLNSQKALDSLRESEISDRDTPLSDSKQSMNPARKKSLENLWKVEMYKPMTTELGVLIKRSFKQIWRRPLLLRLQIILAIIAALLSIAMFSNMQRDIAGVQNRLGFFFFQLAFFGFAGISSIDLILEERSVFIREIQGKFYTPLAYYLSKVIVDGIMLRILPMLIYDLLVYWSIGLREGAAHFALYLISTLLFSLATGALSVAVTMGSKTGGVASLGIILLLLFSILFGGFLSNRGAIPDWIGWIQYLSIYYQVMGVLVSNEMRGTTFSTTISKGIEIEISADQVLDKIEFAVEPNLTSYVGALAALYFAWILIGYVLMKMYLSDGSWKRLFKKQKQC